MFCCIVWVRLLVTDGNLVDRNLIDRHLADGNLTDNRPFNVQLTWTHREPIALRDTHITRIWKTSSSLLISQSSLPSSPFRQATALQMPLSAYTTVSNEPLESPRSNHAVLAHPLRLSCWKLT